MARAASTVAFCTMWAMGQSALGSGMSTVFFGERSFALSAMKRTPAKTSVLQSSVAAFLERKNESPT